MKLIMQSLLLMLFINTPVMGATDYQPNSGDKELDETLIIINKNINNKKLNKFVDKVAEEFQIPPQKVEALFNHYKLNAADVLMSVSIADVSGEPLQNISGLYFKNKEKGWKYTLQQLNIHKNSKVLSQIKKDMKIHVK